MLNRLNRKNQLPILVLLAASTAIAQYVLQGTMATGDDPSLFGSEFYIAEQVLWGLRALIEAWIICYLFMTEARTKTQQAVLVAFEFGLIALLTLTLAPVVYTMSQTSPIQSILSNGQLWAWSFGISSFTSLMIGAVGYAYKVQPNDTDMEVVNKGEMEKLQRKIEDQSTLIADMSTNLEQSNSELDKIQTRHKEVVHLSKLFGKLSVTNRLRLLELLARMEGRTIIGTKPGQRAQDWADDNGVSVQTVYEALKEPEKVLRLNGNGNGENND